MSAFKEPLSPSMAHIDRLLDIALAQTFPASDPVAIDIEPVPPPGGHVMTKDLKLGDRVSWNSEAGRVSGRIVKIHTKKVNYKGYIHHASKDDPQYEIASDKTDHVALHKRSALRRLPR